MSAGAFVSLRPIRLSLRTRASMQANGAGDTHSFESFDDIRRGRHARLVLSNTKWKWRAWRRGQSSAYHQLVHRLLCFPSRLACKFARECFNRCGLPRDTHPARRVLPLYTWLGFGRGCTAIMESGGGASAIAFCFRNDEPHSKTPSSFPSYKAQKSTSSHEYNSCRPAAPVAFALALFWLAMRCCRICLARIFNAV